MRNRERIGKRAEESPVGRKDLRDLRKQKKQEKKK
jgi:hypothetical protein